MADPLLAYRDRFPILKTSTYLISNSLGAMPAAVADRMKAYADIWATRGVRAWAEEWWMLPAKTGDLVAPLLGARPGTVAMHTNVTTASAAFLSCLAPGKGRDKVVTTALQFPSILYLLERWCGGNGAGVDVFPYAGLEAGQLLADPTRFPFADGSFETVTFIANLNHVPESLRDAELAEAHRCLAPRGRIVVTMGNPLAEILVHRLVALYDRVFGTRLDVDSERGMDEEEAFYLLDGEIVARLTRAGFREIRKKRFWTQWGLNHLLTGTK